MPSSKAWRRSRISRRRPPPNSGNPEPKGELRDDPSPAHAGNVRTAFGWDSLPRSIVQADLSLAVFGGDLVATDSVDLLQSFYRRADAGNTGPCRHRHGGRARPGLASAEMSRRTDTKNSSYEPATSATPMAIPVSFTVALAWHLASGSLSAREPLSGNP